MYCRASATLWIRSSCLMMVMEELAWRDGCVGLGRTVIGCTAQANCRDGFSLQNKALEAHTKPGGAPARGAPAPPALWPLLLGGGLAPRERNGVGVGPHLRQRIVGQLDAVGEVGGHEQ